MSCMSTLHPLTPRLQEAEDKLLKKLLAKLKEEAKPTCEKTAKKELEQVGALLGGGVRRCRVGTRDDVCSRCRGVGHLRSIAGIGGLGLGLSIGCLSCVNESWGCDLRVGIRVVRPPSSRPTNTPRLKSTPPFFHPPTHTTDPGQGARGREGPADEVEAQGALSDQCQVVHDAQREEEGAGGRPLGALLVRWGGVQVVGVQKQTIQKMSAVYRWNSESGLKAGRGGHGGWHAP